MHSLFKKILPFLLLLAGIMPVVFSLFFLLKQQMIRHGMKESLEQKLLQTITLSKNEVQWVKPGREILVENKMFDVKSFIIEKGYYKFTGLFDHEETVLINDLKNNFKNTDERGSSLLASFFQWLQSVSATDPCDPVFVMKDSESISCLIYIHISFPFKTIPTPPPQT